MGGLGFLVGLLVGLPFPWRVVWYGGFGVLWLILMWWVGYAGFGVLWVVCDYVGFDAVLDFRLLRCFPEEIRFVWGCVIYHSCVLGVFGLWFGLGFGVIACTDWFGCDALLICWFWC